MARRSGHTKPEANILDDPVEIYIHKVIEPRKKRKKVFVVTPEARQMMIDAGMNFYSGKAKLGRKPKRKMKKAKKVSEDIIYDLQSFLLGRSTKGVRRRRKVRKKR